MTEHESRRLLQGINDRIRLTAHSRGVDANRLRRGLVFQRLLARLAPHGLILKGGYVLEVRLAGLSRATKDVDLVGRLALLADRDDVADALDELLLDDAEGDGFSFRCLDPRPLRPAGAAAPAWRVPVEVGLAGARFEVVTVDVVGQVEEVEGAVEEIVVPSPLPGLDLQPVTVLAVDVFQHAAEKLHAMARVYADDRPSSRTKDLVDLVLLMEAGLLADPARLARRLVVVWAQREGSDPPAVLPTPPESWRSDYARLAADLRLATVSLDAAYLIVAELYAAALTEGNHP